MRFSRPALVVLLILTIMFLVSTHAAAQQPPQRDPQAVTLAVRALTALTGGAPVTSVVLTGTATRIAGADHETGPVTLRVRGTQSSRMDLVLSSGSRTHIVNQPGGALDSVWSGPDGTPHPIAFHNSWTDSAWFFPALSSLAALSSPEVALSYLGHEVRQGVPVEHLRFFRQVSSKAKGASEMIQRLSTMDFYLASDSLLPVAVAFNSHPDNDASTDIPTEVHFSDYRLVNGLRVPFRVQKFINAGLTLDLSITAVTLNPALSDSVFSVASRKETNREKTARTSANSRRVPVAPR